MKFQASAILLLVVTLALPGCAEKKVGADLAGSESLSGPASQEETGEFGLVLGQHPSYPSSIPTYERYLDSARTKHGVLFRCTSGALFRRVVTGLSEAEAKALKSTLIKQLKDEGGSIDSVLPTFQIIHVSDFESALGCSEENNKSF
jgi:hypothetical protein